MPEITKERLEEVLAALPPTPDEVAALFEELGIKGARSLACQCPMANYLAEEFGIADPDPVTGWGWTHFYFDAQVVAGNESAIVVSPEHLLRFAQNFDENAYPALVVAEVAE